MIMVVSVSFADRAKVTSPTHLFTVRNAHCGPQQDTLKISGNQVSPAEIENVLLTNPKRIIVDVTVAGVSGGRTSDEKVPRAWVVLSDAGKKIGAEKVIEELEAWHQENLSKYKWLRGGIEVVNQVRLLEFVV
jgi:acyl-CoA synthetase (AMP-forming)/AMP-acid ligase II